MLRCAAASAAWLMLTLGCLGGCARAPAAAKARPKTTVTFAVRPLDAEIWVDGRYVATVREAAGGLRVPQGAHEIELILAGHFPFLAVIEVGATPAHVAATLFPVVP